MHLLHLEDNLDWYERVIEPELMKISSMKIFHAKNKSEALDILENVNIDFALLDLSVPLDNESLIADLQHGLSVAWNIRTSYPGIPVMILTGESTEEAAEKFEEENTFTTYWDGQQKPLVKLRNKRKVAEVIEYISSISISLEKLDATEIDFDQRELALSNYEQRIIKLFCLKNKAIAARVKALNKGLSSAKVLNVTLINDSSKQMQSVLVKIDDNNKVEIEKVNFQNYITNLAVGSIPTYIDEFYAGCSNKKGVVFQFAKDYNKNYFDIYLESDEKSLNIVTLTKHIFTNWVNQKSGKQVTIGEIRNKFCSDDKLLKYNIKEQLSSSGIDIEDFESKTLQSNFCIQHCDLHGLNILISDINTPLIIDYGDVKKCPSSFDPITLELSQYFHPEMRGKIEHNMTLAEHWFDDQQLASLSANPKTAIFLREWAKENAFLKRDYIAGVYSYVIKQLTYPDTNKDFAKMIIVAAIKEFQ